MRLLTPTPGSARATYPGAAFGLTRATKSA